MKLLTYCLWSVTYSLNQPCYQRNRICQVSFKSILGVVWRNTDE